MDDIYNLPENERRVEAVRRFRIITGESIFNNLLGYLELCDEEFTNEYGDKLAANPNYCNHLLVEMVRKSFTKRYDGGCLK